MRLDANRKADVIAKVSRLAAAHQPGFSLDQAFYCDPEIYALELERIVYRNWILAGHVSEWPESGDFRTMSVADESAIVVRGNDGAIRGFANVCRHRGSLVCLEKFGTVRKFACPYHGWVYDLEGRLTAARAMPDGFDFSTHGLKPVAVGMIHGLVFIAFCEDPPSLDGAIRELAEPMAMFDFENLIFAVDGQDDFFTQDQLDLGRSNVFAGTEKSLLFFGLILNHGPGQAVFAGNGAPQFQFQLRWFEGFDIDGRRGGFLIRGRPEQVPPCNDLIVGQRLGALVAPSIG